MRKVIFLFFLIFSASILAQDVIDKIVAIVDNEIILQSELEFQINLMAAQRGLNPDDPGLKDQILSAMIEDKLLYAQAEIDSIVVSPDEVNQQLDYQMNYITQQYGSRERVEEVYGMSLERIKREYRDDVRKNLMTQRIQAQKFGEIDVTRREAEEFFSTFQDSLGVIPEKFNIAHIFINPKAGERVKKKAKDLAISLLDSIKKNGNFAELARQFSDDPGSASQGGDLGFVKRGVFFPEFEAAAFALAEGELSGIVESPVGYHIIELLERRGESIHTRHILLKTKSDDEADLESIEFLTDLRDSIINEINTFDHYAKELSDDKESARFGGELGTFEVGQLEKPLLDVVYKLKPGEISFPKRLEIDKATYGFHIVKLINRTPEHKASMEQDYDEIKRLAEFNKKQKLYTEWIGELKSKIYWETRL